MTHQRPDPAGDGLDGWEEPTAETLDQARPAPSGLRRVDAVVAALADLDPDDLAEHVAVIDRAHAELRAALDDPGENDAEEDPAEDRDGRHTSNGTGGG